MTRIVEASGKSVTEATARALAKFGIASEQANIEVIERGRKSFLGLFGGAPARVAVSQRVSVRARAEEIVADLLRLMRLSSQLHVTEERNTLIIDIETAGSDGLLIGKGGNTLSALEYVANRMLQRGSKKSPKIILDVSGYKRRRGDFLKSKALSLAEQVKAAKKQVTTEPMDATDRSIIHAVLKSDPAVETRSIGQGRVKSIVVAPAKGGSKSRNRGGQRRRRRQPKRK
ncbi:MAG: Jag N-terminal domain-containing protein [Candidatus Eisenbacteria sp.]|nr:Jag N-terminal domain-containing protein [Candidatus Eisenbacteria bacterium]